MDWNEAWKNYQSILIIVLVFFSGFGHSLATPGHENDRLENPRPNTDTTADSSASTAEIFRNIQKLVSISKPLGIKRKLLKQEAEPAEGSANALAYLTDSFGGQLAGQILSLILSTVTGDVRGILGNSVNLFQNDERRDRVQLFLDDISHNFLKFTGLNNLVTTQSPLQSTLYPGGPFVLGAANVQNQLAIQPAAAQTIPIASLGRPVVPPAFAPASPVIGSNLGSLQNTQQTSAPAAAQQPIIYVLPQLANGGTTGTQGTKTGTRNKATTASSGDDDSEEERKLWSN